MTEAPSEGLRLEVTAEESYEVTLTDRIGPALVQPDIARDFPEADHWLVGSNVCEKLRGRPYAAMVQDAVSGRATLVEGDLDDVGGDSVTYLPFQRPPSDDEFAWAVSMVREHEEKAATQRRERAEQEHGDLLENAEDEVVPPFVPPVGVPPAEVYRPLPPLANVIREDGTVRRIVTVGLRATDGVHQIVGVEAGTGDLVAGVPLPAGATEEFGLAPVQGAEPPPGGAQQVRLKVLRGDEELWNLLVVRPSASSGTNGSGVELRDVRFAGLEVLERAHLPIVILRACGPDAPEGTETVERVWMNDESGFDAEPAGAEPAGAEPAGAEPAGAEPAGAFADAGFRVCAPAPQTALTAGADGGGFRGVALWTDGQELVLTSQVRSGWHRFVVEWRLAADGTIRARTGFAAARQPGVARDLTIEAYWRFDFDILGSAENTVQEHNQPPVFGTGPWNTVRYEIRRACDWTHDRYWRVRHDKSSRSYSLMPGPVGGRTWILRHHSGELDDGVGATEAPERVGLRLDDLVSGEPVHREDLVMWCSTVWKQPADGPMGELVGPDLVPRRWVPAPPLVDPPLLEPDPK